RRRDRRARQPAGRGGGRACGRRGGHPVAGPAARRPAALPRGVPVRRGDPRAAGETERPASGARHEGPGVMTMAMRDNTAPSPLREAIARAAPLAVLVAGLLALVLLAGMGDIVTQR